MNIPSSDIEIIARICHEANRTYCISIGDLSQPTWAQAPDWQRDSAINGVKAHLKSDLTPRESHEAWFAQKYDEGWKYGPVKDAVKKEHPCMLPYDHLPPHQRLKDHLFGNIVRAFKSAYIEAAREIRA